MGDRIALSDIIAPSFYKVHSDIKKRNHTYYDLYGGRGSTKSSFASVEIVYGIMCDSKRGEMTNAVVFHKFSIMLRDSVFSQIEWAIDALGATDYWKST